MACSCADGESLLSSLWLVGLVGLHLVHFPRHCQLFRPDLKTTTTIRINAIRQQVDGV